MTYTRTGNSWGRCCRKLWASCSQCGRRKGEVITRELARVQERAPEIVADYRRRLQEKLQAFLTEQGVTLEPASLVKEVAIFAERTDINEEIVRLTSHLQQFHEFLNEKE